MAATLGTADGNDLQRSAELAVQEEYDKYMESNEEDAMDVGRSESMERLKESAKKEDNNDVEVKEGPRLFLLMMQKMILQKQACKVGCIRSSK